MRNATYLAIFTTITIACLSLKTITIQSPLEISFLDKILHLIAYFVLAILWFFSQRNNNTHFIFIIIALIFYGILLEFCQGWFNQNRTKDFYDILANSFGVIVAAILFKYFDKPLSKKIKKY